MGNKYKKLAKCIVLDIIGMSSAAIPVVGPFIDVIWAPVAASLSYKMFGNKIGKYTSLVTFVEEILPVTDVIPSFTIFWVLFDFLEIGKEKSTFVDTKEADLI
ncbi:MAG: hypothetical protein PHO13_03585 [Fermentimonas sp.]|jgi:hypothetical protein|nr:hypothetical protein [Fermentimonas sp.]NLC86340.1 hypothetical protein [Bacteroidales bacterium]HBT85319.1 hypothetical protein [Porphyromonadaceae bacterium]MDD2930511.1 hypothetical protein [Fermentimonas sp.]MDD3188565.1 hypothetical protein [Fermentimonas sp.]